MAGFLSNFFGKKSSSVIGIDIGSSSIKVVQLARRAGKAVLETYGELALGPYGGFEIGKATNLPPEKISEALRDIVRESKVTAKSAGAAIPFGSSLIVPIEMPAVDSKQLAQMIPIEARKYIPVPITEVMLDWIVVPKALDKATGFDDDEEKIKKGDKLDVLLVAIHNETLARYQTIVEQAELPTSFFEIEIFSAIRSVLDQEMTSQMIMDLGAASTKAYIVERGIVRTSHVINRGAQDVTIAISKSLGVSLQNAEILKRDLSQVPIARQKDVQDIIALTLDYIFSEGQRAVLSYQKRWNKDVPRVVMLGGGARLGNILKIAESHFQTEVTLGDPFGKTESPAFLEQILRDTGPEFAVAVGIALRKLQEIE